MDLNSLTGYINLVILGICLCVGYAIKTGMYFIPNRYIPLIMLILGTLLSIFAYGISLNTILSGMLSGLSSTGMYEAFKNMISTK